MNLNLKNLPMNIKSLCRFFVTVLLLKNKKISVFNQALINNNFELKLNKFYLLKLYTDKYFPFFGI